MADLPACLMPFTKLTSLADLFERETHGGLVENDDFGVEEKGAYDGDALFLTTGILADPGIRTDRMGGKAHGLGHQPVCFISHPLNIQETHGVAEFASQKDIAPQGLQFGQGAFLIDGFHTQFPGFGNREVIHFLAIEINLARGGLIITGDDLDQGGFSGAVITQQADNFIPAQLKVDILKRLDFSKGFGHVSKFEAVFHTIISVPVIG